MLLGAICRLPPPFQYLGDEFGTWSLCSLQMACICHFIHFLYPAQCLLCVYSVCFHSQCGLEVLNFSGFFGVGSGHFLHLRCGHRAGLLEVLLCWVVSRSRRLSLCQMCMKSSQLDIWLSEFLWSHTGSEMPLEGYWLYPLWILFIQGSAIGNCLHIGWSVFMWLCFLCSEFSLCFKLLWLQLLHLWCYSCLQFCGVSSSFGSAGCHFATTTNPSGHKDRCIWHHCFATAATSITDAFSGLF